MQILFDFLAYFRFLIVGLILYPLVRRFSDGLARAVLLVAVVVQLLKIALDILI